jgi:hypothetical protein
VYWIDLSQDRDQWQVLMNMVFNLVVTKMLGISSIAAKLATSQEGLSSMKSFDNLFHKQNWNIMLLENMRPTYRSSFS